MTGGGQGRFARVRIWKKGGDTFNRHKRQNEPAGRYLATMVAVTVSLRI